MTLQTYAAQAVTRLTRNNVETARLDVLVLMEAVLGVDRAQLLAHPELELFSDQENVLNDLLARRAKHEPLAYLLKQNEFYGREFMVSEAVLVPRPESEMMIDLLKKLLSDAGFLANRQPAESPFRPADQPTTTANRANTIKQPKWRLADIGTGSGALGITAALEVLNLTVELLEIDDPAIEIAKANVIKHTTGIPVIKSDLLDNVSTNYDILLCNLPYVPDGYAINEAAKHEPKLALFGGPDGLDLYRRLFQQIKKLSYQPLLILCESLPAQHKDLIAIAAQASYQQHVANDFIQAFIPA